MGVLVAAVAMTHNPRIYWNGPAADEPSRQAVGTIFGELRRIVGEARPDRLIVIANDHLDNFFLDNMPQFCVGLGSQAEGPFWYESEVMHLPAYRAAVDAEIGEHLLNVGMQRGVDFSQTHAYRLDHAFTVPLSVVRPEQDLPIVPVFTNVFAYPLPTEHRFLEVGQTIRALVQERPKHERIAVVTSFNLSVDVGGPRMGKRDDTLDRRALELIKQGDVDAILRELTVERLLHSGNSTAEFLNYDAILGVVEDRPPSYLEYRLVPAWGGVPAVAWTLT